MEKKKGKKQDARWQAGSGATIGSDAAKKGVLRRDTESTVNESTYLHTNSKAYGYATRTLCVGHVCKRIRVRSRGWSREGNREKGCRFVADGL